MQKNYIVNLGILIAVFVVGFISLMGIDFYFDEFIEEKFNVRIHNQQMRYRIGERIISHIDVVESHYYKLATLNDQGAIAQIRKDIFEETAAIRKLLQVLDKGGSVEVQVGLNLPDIEAIKEVLVYKKDGTSSHTSMEFIDLIPKINSLEAKVDELAKFIEVRQSKNNLYQTEQEIVIFLKQLPTYFIRMKENAGRLLYESREEMLKVKAKSEAEQAFYMKVQYVIAFLVMVLITLLGTFLARGILKTNAYLVESNEKAKALAVKAQMADHAKSLFLANMSHEIRTPLNGIIGFASILMQSAVTPQNREYARIIYENSNALLDIINDILDLSKVEQGSIEIEKEPFKILDMIDRIVELFAIKAKEKSLRFYCYASPAIPELLIGDTVRLRQVLSNLVGNAIKFTPKGGKIYFSVRQKEITDEYVTLRFSIQDSGIGIPREQQKKVFDPFIQADEGISRKFGGTGLGLSISSDIIQKMGSRIQLESEQGKGSHFFFDITLPIGECVLSPHAKEFSHRFAILGEPSETPELLEVLQIYLHKWGNLQAWHPHQEVDALFCYIPLEGIEETLMAYKKEFPKTLIIGFRDDCLAEVPVSLEALVDHLLDCPIYGSKIFNTIVSLFKEEVHALENGPQISSYGHKILVAEDNPTNRHLMQIYLEKLGVAYKMAENGKEAVALYQQEEFDAILMDINMPIMDGVGATEAIRTYNEEHNRRAIPIIALTANALKGDKERYLAQGMDGHLSKPINFEELRGFFETLHPKEPIHSEQKACVQNAEPSMCAPKIVEEIKKVSLDKAAIAEKMGLDVVTVEMILDNFFLTLEDDLVALENACKEQNAEAIKQKAHYLKGACANLYLQEAEGLLAVIEEDPIGKRENVSQIRAYLESIKS